MKLRLLILCCIMSLVLACELQNLLSSPTATSEPTPRPQPSRTSIPTQPPVVVASPSPIPIPPTPVPEPVFGTANENLRVRGSPSTSAPILDRLNKGSRAEIVGRTAANDWYQISLPTNPNARGWVSADFIDLAGSLDNVPVIQPGVIYTPAPPPTAPPGQLPPVPTVRPYPYP